MKKTISFVMLIICLSVACSMLIIGCTSLQSTIPYQGVDLTDNALISASDNNEKAGNLTDNSSSLWTTKTQGASITIEFDSPTMFNTVVLREPTDNVQQFEIHVLDPTSNQFEMSYRQDRIDKYRMCALDNILSSKIKVVFTKFNKKLSISDLEVFDIRNSHQNFIRQAYMTSDKQADSNLSYIQAKENDADFLNSLNVLTDVILIGCVSVTEQATFTFSNSKESLQKDIQILKKLTNDKLRVHVTIMTSLVPGNFHKTNQAIVKLVKNKMDTFKNNMRELVEQLDVDGIDYDWEYPQLPSEWSAYSQLLIQTKAAINGRQLSVALWPYGVNLSKQARQCIDVVNAMAYDQFDNRNDHSSIYNCGLKTIEYFSSLGFSNNQILLGIPFYGRTTDRRSYWPSYDESYGKWDNFKPDYHYVDYDAITEFDSSVYLNGYAMVRDKTALAIASDIGGIMIFRFCSDLPYSYEYSLHRAVHSTITQRLK